MRLTSTQKQVKNNRNAKTCAIRTAFGALLSRNHTKALCLTQTKKSERERRASNHTSQVFRVRINDRSDHSNTGS